MVTKLLMVTGKAKEIADTQSYSAQYITLNSQSIPVPDDHLHYRVNALLLQKCAASEAGHADDGSLVIGDINGIAAVTKDITMFLYYRSSSPLRRTCLSSNGKLPAF